MRSIEFSMAVEPWFSVCRRPSCRFARRRYGLVEDSGRTNMAAGVEHSVGSGVVVSPDGFVVTNAHT